MTRLPSAQREGSSLSELFHTRKLETVLVVAKGSWRGGSLQLRASFVFFLTTNLLKTKDLKADRIKMIIRNTEHQCPNAHWLLIRNDRMTFYMKERNCQPRIL